MKIINADALWAKVTANFDDFLSLADLWEYIDATPSAEPEPPECICGECDAWNKYKSERKTSRWIPCTERLPEKHQMVITTIVGTDFIRMKPGETFEDAVARVRKNVRVSVGYIEEDGWYGADGYPQIVAPIAWMPLPEPFVEDKNE